MDVAAGRNPARAIGLAWAPVDPGPRRLAVAFEGADEAPPRGVTEAVLKIDGLAPGDRAYATIAAVDVGILNLTGFEPPGPGRPLLRPAPPRRRDARRLRPPDRRPAGHARPPALRRRRRPRLPRAAADRGRSSRAFSGVARGRRRGPRPGAGRASRLQRHRAADGRRLDRRRRRPGDEGLAGARPGGRAGEPAALPRSRRPRPASASTSPTPPAPPATVAVALAADPGLLPEGGSFAGTLGENGRLVFDAAARRHDARRPHPRPSRRRRPPASG